MAVVPSIRTAVLATIGRALVVDEPVGPADIIVVSLDSGGAGALEAADLVQGGIAKRVAVFTDPPSGEDWEFIRRGLPYEDASASQIRQLRSLGVADILQISRFDASDAISSTNRINDPPAYPRSIAFMRRPSSRLSSWFAS
jgi:hypothetical protein